MKKTFSMIVDNDVVEACCVQTTELKTKRRLGVRAKK